MMNDWTDIIGEELKNLEAPLPADDWSVLQQKYSASRRRRRTVVLVWSGALASVAAVLAIVVMIFRNEPVLSVENQYVADAVTVSGSVEDFTEDVVPSEVVHVDIMKDVSDKRSKVHDVAEEYAKVEDTFHVVEDTTSVVERLVADAGHVTNEEEEDYIPGGVRFEDLPSDDGKKGRKKISLGVSGSGGFSGGSLLFMVAQDSAPGDVTVGGTEPPYGSTDQVDSLSDKSQTKSLVPVMRGERKYKDNYNHQLPVSAGISARFFLTDRFSVNTGLNYTRYTSTRTRSYSSGWKETEMQHAHYLGIPLRFDWMLVDRKQFGFYLGAGGQVDKCIYAKVGSERLYEKDFLFSLTGAAGLQLNLSSLVSLYLEPDIAVHLNEGSLETYRTKGVVTTVISARAGLRFSF